MWFYLLWKKYPTCYIYYIRQGALTRCSRALPGAGLSQWGLPPLLHILKMVGEWPSCMMDKVHCSTGRYVPNIYSPVLWARCSSRRHRFTEHTKSETHQWADLVTDRCHIKLLSTHWPILHAYPYIRTDSLAIEHNESRCLSTLCFQNQSF